MAFNDKEISTQDGRPAALYRLDWGNTSWFYTSADRKITRTELVKGVNTVVTYEPRAMKDSGMVQGGSQQNDFTVEGPSDLPIVRLFRGSPPSESIWLTVRRCHDADGTEAPIYWTGYVMNLKRPTDAKCAIIGQPLSASLKRTGLRLCWTRECPHFLYDPGCKVDPEAYRVNGEVVSFNGTTIVVTLEQEMEGGWFRGGFIAWEANDDGTLERRFIEADVAGDEGTTLTIFGLVDFLDIGDAVALYPGCSRTPSVCDGKFSNIDNYGGFDKMPGASPFNTPIW
jgi:uncharacterized phage protein (TIGR02218 family)